MKCLIRILITIYVIVFNSLGQEVKIYILYGDTNGYDSTVLLRGCCGRKYPVTIIASQDGNNILKDRFTVFKIDTKSNLAVYSSSNYSDQDRINQAKLDSGKATIWIKSTSGQINNCKIGIYPVSDTTIKPGERGKIYMDLCGSPTVKNAFYRSCSGLGKVDMLEIYYNMDLEKDELYDSLYLFWPDTSDDNRRVVRRNQNNITLDTNDLSHVTVKINEPFKNGFTGATYKIYGVSYSTPPYYPESLPFIYNFDISDSVGPIISYAGISNKGDFLFVCFSEPVKTETVYGKS